MKKKFFFRVDLILRTGYQWIFCQNLVSRIWQKNRENREIFSRKQFLSLS